MIYPFLVGVTVWLAVAATALWVGRAYCKECRARRRTAA